MTDLSKQGFTKADSTIYNRLIMSISGLEKSGKTHFALTAPGPIAYFDADIGSEVTVPKFAKEKDIWIYKFTTPDNEDDAAKIWAGLVEAYHKALKMARTVVVDTATDMWELLRMAELGSIARLKRGSTNYDYMVPNAIFKGLIKRDAMAATGTNLILLHKMKKQYANNAWNGKYERSGFGDAPFLVQANCEVYRGEPWTDDDGKMHSGSFYIYIKDCGHNPDLQGMEYEDSLCTFPIVAAEILGNSPGEWL